MLEHGCDAGMSIVVLHWLSTGYQVYAIVIVCGPIEHYPVTSPSLAGPSRRLGCALPLLVVLFFLKILNSKSIGL